MENSDLVHQPKPSFVGKIKSKIVIARRKVRNFFINTIFGVLFMVFCFFSSGCSLLSPQPQNQLEEWRKTQSSFFENNDILNQECQKPGLLETGDFSELFKVSYENKQKMETCDLINKHKLDYIRKILKEKD